MRIKIRKQSHAQDHDGNDIVCGVMIDGKLVADGQVADIPADDAEILVGNGLAEYADHAPSAPAKAGDAAA
ncbi:hypothetical protein BL248_08385 [Ralstonia solanacearum]|nr:hypothetical protein BL248_08385 [Ralstonia solanacearum]